MFRTMENREQTIREVVGENVRRIREKAGARQDDVSTAARSVGLSWTRSKITALERGEKALDLADAVLLAEAMAQIAGQPVSIAADLFAGDGAVRLSPVTVIQREALRRFLGGDPVRLFAREGERTSNLFSPFPDAAHAQMKAGEAEERAGRTLGISKLEVAHLAVGLWGLTLGEERDRRVGDEVPLASRSAKRGRVTRQLVEDLRVRLEEVSNVER
jgi:transcriptional regulator with XRE-family HTH domain